MGKKIIINENDFKKIVKASILQEANVSDADIDKKVKDAVSRELKNDKEIEKKVKKIVAQSVNTLFKTLWQRSNFYENEITK